MECERHREFMLRHMQLPADCPHVRHLDDMHPRSGLVAARELDRLCETLDQVLAQLAHDIIPFADIRA